MNEIKNKSLLESYEELIQMDSDDPFEISSSHRKSLAFVHDASRAMDCALKKDILKEHIENYISSINIDFYNAEVNKILTQTNSSNNSFQWKSNIRNFSCLTDENKSHDLSDKNDLLEFRRVFSKKVNVFNLNEEIGKGENEQNERPFGKKTYDGQNIQDNKASAGIKTFHETKFHRYKSSEDASNKPIVRNILNRFSQTGKRECDVEDDDDDNKKRGKFSNQSDDCGTKQEKINDENRKGTFSKTFNQKGPKNTDTKYQSEFKTARQVFNQESVKKYGNKAPQLQSNQHKSLGLKKSLSSKFVSPMISNNDCGKRSMKQYGFEQDERLKNIDPKMVELISSEIMDTGATVNWGDIAGLEFAKTTIQEAVVWPMLRPDIFTGLRRPPKGILLFGPPGTGKTLIGKCVASQSKSTFFSISASSLTSKWIGDGEKMVRALFTVARCHQPAVIFIDEIDSLLSQRSDTEHESSRRIKTEFLVQLDGATTENEERLLVIGATNRPQELDEAARRRFIKRLYIPLPEVEARSQLVQRLMANEKHSLTDNDFGEIARLSNGYSGADIKSLCSDASLGPIRSINLSQIEMIQASQVRAVTMDDFRKALSRVRSSVGVKDLDQYLTWNETYGLGSF